MRRSTYRKLSISVGLVIMIVAGWIAVERFSESAPTVKTETKVKFGHSRSSKVGFGKRVPKTRSIEELERILEKAAEDWENLQPTQFFAKRYTDKVVSRFSPAEIESLGLLIAKNGKILKRGVGGHGFHKAIMRRWGEIDPDRAKLEIKTTISELVVTSRALLKDKTLALIDDNKLPRFYAEEDTKALHKYLWISERIFPERLNLFEQVLIGASRRSPERVIADVLALSDLVETGETPSSFSRALEYLNERELLEQIFVEFTRQDSTSALSFIKQQESREDFEIRSMMKGYLQGLPDQSEWNSLYSELQPEFQAALRPQILSRWITEDHSSAITWLKEQNTPDDFLRLDYNPGDPDPFATDADEDPFVSDDPPSDDVSASSEFDWETLSDHEVYIQFTLGEAIGTWILKSPNDAFDWVSEHRELNTFYFSEGFYEQIIHYFYFYGTYLDADPTPKLDSLREKK